MDFRSSLRRNGGRCLAIIEAGASFLGPSSCSYSCAKILAYKLIFRISLSLQKKARRLEVALMESAVESATSGSA